MTATDLFLGVDVGTGSARAGIFTGSGQMLAQAAHPIRLWREGETVVEQSSADIWAAVCRAVADAVAQSGVDPSCICGIGFDATCSLVVVGPGGTALTASHSGDPARDVIVWMDHRAEAQAERINTIGGTPLTYVGNRISPEMELPKLLWLKEILPESFARAEGFMDLTDYLTWRATGSDERSTCTVTCKWTYLPHLGGWDIGFLQKIGLGSLADNGFARIGARIVSPGTPVGQGLSAAAAADLGLPKGTPVGAGLIDAHAGGLGSLPVSPEGGALPVAYVFGTSACLMSSSATPLKVNGIWGPYRSAMLPDLWLLEGGQTVAGAAIDHVLRAHPAWAAANEAVRAEGLSLLSWLEQRVLSRHPDISTAARDVARMHSILDLAGNRAPLADPALRGLLTGISLSEDLMSLERTYVAAVLGVAYGARRIFSALEQAGAGTSMIVISGGAAKSALVRQLLADATGLPVARPRASEPVLLGAAMLGAVAAGRKPGLDAARADMVALDEIAQSSSTMTTFHDWKYSAYCRLQDTERAIWAEYETLIAPKAAVALQGQHDPRKQKEST
jgi:D-ribulokinase